jgi:hypothetical protein
MAPCESAATLAWVDEHVGALARSTWTQVRGGMGGPASGLVETGHWLSDPWLARSSAFDVVVGVRPMWAPPDELDQWPSRGAREIASGVGDWQRSNHAAFARVIDAGGAAAAADGAAAAETMTALHAAASAGDTTAIIQVEQVLAWLDTAVGRPFRSIVLSTTVEPRALVPEFFRRFLIPFRSKYVGAFNERRLEDLYNLELAPGGSVGPSWTRVGQGEGWREAWQALSTDLDAETLADTVRLTARAMRCAPLLGGLVGCLDRGDDDARQVALCMVRRWMLSLRAMAWLEIALAARWQWVRPCDLACFAYNAVKPDFPRRTLAVSHRSSDAKPILIAMEIWGAARVAIDATYVPAWETNTGMVWGLFASTPAIARVRSANYAGSLWCRRELEITQYLRDGCDFMSERWVGDLDLKRVRTLDRARIGTGIREFPPFSELWTVDPAPRWELLMLRAAALLRIMNAFLRDPQQTNGTAARLAAGEYPDRPVMTNHPGGWEAYGAVFRALNTELGVDTVPLRLPADYADADADAERGRRLPNLAAGTPALDDVLVAYEWLRREWPWMISGENYAGDRLVLDLRGLTRTSWANDESLSLLRGVAAVRLPAPLWFMQTADQDVENWALIGDRPIFTQHVPLQFDWMFIRSLRRGIAQAIYPDNCGLELSRALLLRCFEAAKRVDGQEPVALRDNPWIREILGRPRRDGGE